MHAYDDLLRRLDAAGPDGWEAEYARRPIETTRDHASEVVESERAYADWFAFRFDAGPPGVPLPPYAKALDALLGGSEGTPLDAYRILFASRRIREDAEAEVLLAILCNAAASALKRGTTWLATWLSARAGLAAIALGAPDRAWLFLDGLTIGGRRHPHLDKLAIFEPIRGNPLLERNLWVRAAICRLWPGFEVPAIPRMPFPDMGGEEGVSLEETLAETSRIGASQIRDIVKSFVQAANLAAIDEHADDPLVRELRTRAMVPGSAAPKVDELPPWFADWARAVARSGEVRLSRLAGLVLHRSNARHASLAAVLVLPTARAADLSLISAGLAASELHPLFDELAEAASVLPVSVADALVAAALPRHADHSVGLGVLTRHADLLESINAKAGGVVEQVTDMIRWLSQDRARDHLVARPQVDRLIAAVRQAAGRLAAGRCLDGSDVERAAGTVDVAGLTTGFLELGMEQEGLEPLEHLLLALALRRAVSGTEHEKHWLAPLSRLASEAIFARGEPALFRLRLKLLDEVIGEAHPLISRAELHYQRANTRRAVSPTDVHEAKLALEDWRMAIRLARGEGDPVRCAAATAAWVKNLVRVDTGTADSGQVFTEADRAIEQALELPLDPFHQAVLHQARAHLLRPRSPEEAVTAFESALALVEVEDQFRAELAAEIVETLVRVGLTEEAVSRGLAFLDEVSCTTPHTELGMLHLAVGEALAKVKRTREARQHLEAGLAQVRGRDPLNEARCRVHLARLGLAAGDHELADEHLRFLRDHRDELDLSLLLDVYRLEASAAGARGDTDAERASLAEALWAATDETVRAHLRLEMARADLAVGRTVDGLDGLILQALDTSADGELDGVVMDILRNHDASLSEATREALIGWAHQRARPSIAARMHHLAGRDIDARSTLRTALSAPLDDLEHCACVHQLITVLEPESREERRQLCVELERLLDTVHDDPRIRLDLATALHMDAEDNRDVLRGAWRHARQALELVRDERIVEHGHRTLGRITVDLMRTSLPESSAAVAELANWLLSDLAIPTSEAVQLRLAAVDLLLRHGPFTHPKAIDVARRLVDHASSGVSTEGQAEPLNERQRWIERCLAAKERVTPIPSTLGVPIDYVPGWLVGLVLGGQEPLSPKEVAGDLGPLAVVLLARPDVADRVLASLLPLQHRLPGRARGELLGAVWTTVQSSIDRGDDAWPELRRSLAAIHRKHRHPMLSNIASVINRSRASLRRDRNRSVAPRPKPVRKVRGKSGGPQRARDCFELGVTLKQSLQDDPLAPDAAERLGESRELLAEAVRIARKKRMPELFDYIVSCGNACKTSPGEDIDKALRIYDSAAKLDAGSDQRAKLWKVQADALRERGGPDDLRAAKKLLERSLGLRSGWLRAETLWSAADVALAHPDLDQAEREIRAARFLMDAVRTDRRHSEQTLGLLLRRLAEWQRLRPDDRIPARLRDELKAAYPARALEIDESVARATARDVDVVNRMSTHPASQAFISVRIRLMSTAESGVDGLGLWDRFGPSVKARMAEQVERTSLVGRPDEAEDLLTTLADAPRDAARPGVLAARVALLAYLARHGRRTAADVRSATTESLEAIPGVDDALVQSILLQGIAGVWSPDDHAEDPVRDFSLAVDLLRRCVELEGGEEKALDDTLGLLARGLRYSPAGDLEKNLREARRLYQVRLKRARESGGPDLIANVLHNLANVESQMGTGSRLERLRASETLLQEAVAMARAPFMKAHLWASLAWEQTQIGMLLAGDVGRRQLEQALATFGLVDSRLLDDHYRRNIEGNRTACEVRLARLTGGRDAEIALWRQRLQALDDTAAPYSIAIAKHNLANALMFGEDVTREQFAEGLRLCGESVQIHTVEANPRHHWETAFGVGRALVGALRAGRFDLLPLPPDDAASEAWSWLRRAVEAARVLGPGEEMADAAFELCELGLCAVSTAEMTEQTEKAWTALHEAAAYLVLHLESREKEARMALQVASKLAYRLAERALAVSMPGLTFVLQGKDAELVGRWLLRSQQPVRRPLRARLSRPGAVSASLWEDWRTAINSGGQRRIADVLDSVREVAPEFLSEDLTNESTWTWLEARPGSAAVACVLADPVSLAFLMQVDPAGRRHTWVLGLGMPPPPRPLDSLTDLMRGSVPGADAGHALDSIATWLRDFMVAPVERFLGSPPTSVLWSPGPGLRLIGPGAIWRSTPVATTTSFALPDLRSSPGRRRSTLLVLADPGETASDPRLDLKGHGLPALCDLSGAAMGRGPVRLLGSVGKRFGRPLFGEGSEVRNTPASALDVLSEAGEHEVVVLLAHGEVETPENAAILCVGASGNIERLGVAQVGQTPDCFAGATVLLLSCDGGRVGDSLADPGGVAGTLISAGARCVVAPLWSVFIGPAREVGREVLKGLTAGEEPWEALANLQVGARGESPGLGGPPPPLSEQSAKRSLQQLAFVTWVG